MVFTVLLLKRITLLIRTLIWSQYCVHMIHCASIVMEVVTFLQVASARAKLHYLTEEAPIRVHREH